MQHNQHKRLAKIVVRGFDPTWLGEPAEPSSTAAVLPPVVTTPDAQPTTALQTSVPPLTTSTPTPAAPATTSTPAAQTTEALTTSSQVTTEQSTSALQTSATPLTTAVQSTTPQTAAVATTTPVVRISTPATTRNVVATASVRGGTTVTQTVDASATPSETALPESPGNVGTIVGAVAGSLVGLVVLVAFVSWIIRKHNKRKGDDFDRQSYLRNSMMIPDEPARPVIGTQAALALARSNNNMGPRPPSMLERKPTYMMPNGQPSPSFVPGQVISFDPGQVVAAPYAANEGPYPSPMAFAAYTPPAQHHQSELSRRPSGAQLLTRQPTNGAAYDPSQAPSPGGYGSEYQQSPGGYNDGYTYPMHPGFAAERGMVQSVTPFQAQQYAEITRALEGPDFAATHESFHPISPVPPSPVSPSPVGHAISDENASTFAPSSTGEKPMANPFEEPQRVAVAPPSLPPIESVSRTGTPIDPNPQHAHWSYDGKAQPGQRLSVAGMPAPVIQAPAMPPAAVTREERTVVVGNGEELKAKRPVSYVDTDDAYGGM